MKELLEQILHPTPGDVWKLNEKSIVIVDVNSETVSYIDSGLVNVTSYPNYIARVMFSLCTTPEMEYIPVDVKLLYREKYSNQPILLTPTKAQKELHQKRVAETKNQKGMKL